ncbi:MAG: branched-chain amino acid ABC transporter permease [Chloroflexota bacterium]|nr:MAG: branched-chain amino acid ABC transporter permease [Chloroflexota bacterium]
MKITQHLRVPKPWIIGVLALCAALVLPLFIKSYWLHVIIVAYLYAILASSWSFLAGYAGQFSFGHMAFMAIGAYTSGLLGKYIALPPLLDILAGTLAAGLAGFVIGYLVLRFKAAYLALFTIAFSEILRMVLKGETQITDGDHGLKVVKLFGETISRLPYYYTILAVLGVVLVLLFALSSSRIGMFLRAIREDEEAAYARGVDIVHYKILAFVITSMMAGLSGSFYAHYIGLITPSMMVLPQMGLVIAMAIIGGVENLAAAAIGGILIQISLEVLRELGAWRLVFFGALLVVTLRFARNGLLAPLFQHLFAFGPRAEGRKETLVDGD